MARDDSSSFRGLCHSLSGSLGECGSYPDVRKASRAVRQLLESCVTGLAGVSDIKYIHYGDTGLFPLSGECSASHLGNVLLITLFRSKLVLGLAFHPTPILPGYTPTPLALGVEELRKSDMRSRTWRSLCLRCLQDGVSVFCGSIAGLQAAVMLLLDGQEGSFALDAVLVTAISGARKLGLHQLGNITLDASASQSAPLGNGTTQPAEPLHIRTEIGIRIW